MMKILDYLFSIISISKKYSNPIFFVSKILLLFREQGTGNREQVRVSVFLSTFLFVATYLGLLSNIIDIKY